jgi:hypothetical protein
MTTFVPALEILPLNYRITLCTVFYAIYSSYAFYSFTLHFLKHFDTSFSGFLSYLVHVLPQVRKP